MTRINANIPVKALSKKHVFAEFREITRVPNAIRSGRYSLKDQPDKFTLGKGHVKFFYDKLLFLKKRYEKLYARCLELDIDCTDKSSAFSGLPIEYMNDWQATDEDNELIKQRLLERAPEYYSKIWTL